YSLGVVLYELVCGQRPHDLGQLDLEQALRVLREQTPRRPSALRAELAGDVESIILRALRPEPEARYPSAASLAADLIRHREGRPVEARPWTWSYQVLLLVRRHRVLAFAGLAVFLVAIVAAIVSALFAVEASRARRAEAERAEAATRMAEESRKLSDWVTLDLLSRIGSLPRGAELQRELAGKVKEHLERVAPYVRDDGEVQRSMAIAWMELGALAGDPGQRNAGRLPEAAAAIQRALEVFKRRFDDDSSDPDRLIDLNVARLRLAGILHEQGEADRALEILSRALESMPSGIAAADPASQRLLGLKATLLRELSALHLARGSLAEAKECGEIGLAARRRCLAALDSEGARRELWVDLMQLASMAISQGQTEEALAYTDEALTLVDDVDLDRDSDLVRANDQVVSLGTRADLLGELGRYEEALALHRKSLALRERLLALDPSNPLLLANASTAVSRVIELMLYLELPASEIEAQCQRNLAIDRRMQVLNPESRDVHVRLSQDLRQMATVLINEQAFDRARVCLEEARELNRELLLRDPKDLDARRGQAEYLTYLGLCKFQETLQVFVEETVPVDEIVEQVDDAREHFVDALAIYEVLERELLPRPDWLDAMLRAVRAYLANSAEFITKIQ
ncbi:MAG: tetratricopeptide repeat protein, partial [Planctomycetes bacterium]|nr:tetratricopeptide repeat protein [Planctomycetota bacterium]